MHFPIVREYQTDIEGKNPENWIPDEPRHTPKGAFSRVIVPEHAPFFVNTLVVKHPNGQELDPTQYRILRLMTRLTEEAGQPVACLIELVDEDIEDVFIDYHSLGHFSLIDNTMLQLINAAINDDRPVYWENLQNKPVVFPPILHGHSLISDIIAWQDLIETLDDYLKLMVSKGREPVQIKIDHYYDLLTNYIQVYTDMLTTFLRNHADTRNEHGLTAEQVGLEKVDNFATANSGNVMQGRKDMHLTPQGLQTIIANYGFDSDQYLKAKLLPLSRFGNTNFVPANIDGSFEGFGGFSETAGITLEPDGSLVYLWNRFDGRTTGLYYSVLTDSDTPAEAELTYTGYKYQHARLAVDGAQANLIAQGSGSECILVGDKAKDLFYIGVTNGSLDPAKHVYSPINLRPLLSNIFNNPGAQKVGDLFPYISIAMMGDWIYIFHSVGMVTPQDNPWLVGDLRYKFIYRVLISDVRAQVPVTAVQQNVTFMDADGVQFNNSPYFRWCDEVLDSSSRVAKCIVTFNPPSNQMNGLYRSLETLVAQNPNALDHYAVKFLAGFYAGYVSPTINNSMTYVMELNYDFNPYTGVMTQTSKTAPFVVDFAGVPIPAANVLNSNMYNVSLYYQGQGINVLDDGRAVLSGSPGYAGFPRAALVVIPSGSKSRYTTVSRLWGRGLDYNFYSWNEILTSPLNSSTNPRHLMYVPTGEFFAAAGRTQQLYPKLFLRTVSGKYMPRPEVTNLNIPNVVSRPLTSNIRPVNALVGMGGATVVVPSASLDAYGIEVGDGAFCMNAQTKDFNRAKLGNGWTPDTGNLNDILLIAQHTNRFDADATVTIVPTLEILYPEAIVNQLKNEVQNVAIKNQARWLLINVCDPTYSTMTARVGWLPVTVCIQYTNAEGTPDRNTLYSTFLTIQPTYSLVNGRRQVTGYTVLDKVHFVGDGQAALYTGRIFGADDNLETAITMHGPMRVRYYLDGSKLSVYVGSGIISYTPGDAFSADLSVVYNDRNSRRWSSADYIATSTAVPTICITPDNGISRSFGWAESTGGAATIQQGAVNNPLLVSAYPETGWIIFFKTDINAIFNGQPYVMVAGTVDLRDLDPAPQNKTYYIYAVLRDGSAVYEVTVDKRLESAYQLWVGKVTTNQSQIVTIERYNVITMNGHRISEIKRGNSIPAASGLVNEEGQIPWFYQSEILP